MRLDLDAPRNAPLVMHLRRILSLTLCALSIAGCNDLDDYRTGEGEAFVGEVIGTRQEEDCSPNEESCSFIRRAFPLETKLYLTFDPDLAEIEPGTLTTDDEAYRCVDGPVAVDSRCIDEDGFGVENVCPRTSGRTFDATPMVPIIPLEHDHLGEYELPGVGRLKNYIFAARPESGPFQGRDLMVFLSLMRDGGTEVRIVSGQGEDCGTDLCREMTECQLFGLFRLRLRSLP